MSAEIALQRRPRSSVNSPLRYAGGKRWLVDHIVPGIAEHLESTEGSTYYEPMVGGGAVAFALGLRSNAPGHDVPMVLGDLSEPLMDFYKQLQRDPGAVYVALVNLVGVYGTAEWGYNQIKERFNHDGFATSARAAAFLYLNRRGFNGLWRVNRKGENNVPVGRYKIDPANPMAFFPGRAQIEAASEAVEFADLRCGIFQDTTADVAAGDVVFLDPPYEAPNGFVAYTKEGFGERDHHAVAHCAAWCADRGAAVLVTVSEASRPRYSPERFTILSTLERRAVNSDGDGRKGVPCLLIVSHGHESIVRSA